MSPSWGVDEMGKIVDVWWRRWAVVGGALALVAAATAAGAAGPSVPRVLRVGAWHGIPGQYASIQAAIDAARPGDWVLVGPGDWRSAVGAAGAAGSDGVRITTPRVHLRGMDRNAVVVDGTRPGSGRPCDPSPPAQLLGPRRGGVATGRSGVVVYKVDGVSVENLTACNFLGAGGEGGNQIWFNGGDASGRQAMGSFRGAWLSATTTYAGGPGGPLAQYGIFASNEYGPGVLAHTYASNMADSAYYVGACPDCNVVLTAAHGENSALGYSGTNSGGHLLIEDSEFDRNTAGIVPNSLNNDDAPPPQDGACPHGGRGPTGTHSCTVIRRNHVHDNNNPNVPASGIAGAAPVGTGIEIVGGSNDTIVGNLVDHQGAWGIVVHDYPDTETPPPIAHCTGGTRAPGVCLFLADGNEVASNTFAHNGFFANPGNGDLANEAMSATPGNCFHANRDVGGPLTSDPPAIESVDGNCAGPSPGDPSLAVALVCASGVLGGVVPGAACPASPATHYPRATATVLLPLVAQPTMPDPCAGVPDNPWCPRA